MLVIKKIGCLSSGVLVATSNKDNLDRANVNCWLNSSISHQAITSLLSTDVDRVAGI